jgi:redox-sensitive bicupin YhaK (pirin superfamily)
MFTDSIIVLPRGRPRFFDMNLPIQRRRRQLLAWGAMAPLLFGASRRHPRGAERTGGAMLTIRRSDERGHADHGWLDSRHTFSFANYYDPKHTGFRTLRVINEDCVAPGAGFPTHPHRDMEIISYVLEGGLEHRDSMGNGSVIRPGEVQRMSAGTGVTHSEYNDSQDDPVRFLQIWILPATKGGPPGYEQKQFGDERRGRLRLVASADGREGSVRINQDASLYASLLDAGEQVEHGLAPDRHAWLQLVSGAVELSGERLTAGDGAAISANGAQSLSIKAAQGSELLLFDLA